MIKKSGLSVFRDRPQNAIGAHWSPSWRMYSTGHISWLVIYFVWKHKEGQVAFERFTQIGRVFRARASLRSNGQIGFNHGALTRFKLTEFTHVVLFYDPERRLVGVKLTSDKTEEGASTLITKNGNGTVSARAFLEYYQILPKTTTQYDIEWNEENKMLIIDMQTASQKTRKRSDKARAA